MKKKFNNHELPHIWAAQKQESGHANNMFFDGPTIYSYGRHFPMARIIAGKIFMDPRKATQPTIVLFTSKGYSNSTAKHLNYTRRAVSHIKMFVVPNVSEGCSHLDNAKYLLSELVEARRATLAAVKHVRMREDHARAALAMFREYLEVFGKEIPSTDRVTLKRAAKAPLWSVSELKRLGEKHERAAYLEAHATERAAAAAVRAEERAAKEIEEAKGYLERWAAGETVTAHYSAFLRLPCRLRVVHNGAGVVETSHGANVRLDEAIYLLGAWQAGTVAQGQQIGPYTVKSVTPGIIKIGCHTLLRAECERVLTPYGAR